MGNQEIEKHTGLSACVFFCGVKASRFFYFSRQGALLTKKTQQHTTV